MESGHDADLYFPFAQICVGLSLPSPLPDVAEYLDSAEDELTSEATRVGSELQVGQSDICRPLGI